MQRGRLTTLARSSSHCRELSKLVGFFWGGGLWFESSLKSNRSTNWCAYVNRTPINALIPVHSYPRDQRSGGPTQNVLNANDRRRRSRLWTSHVKMPTGPLVTFRSFWRSWFHFILVLVPALRKVRLRLRPDKKIWNQDSRDMKISNTRVNVNVPNVTAWVTG